MKAQTENILAEIDALLEDAGTDKSKLLSATIWLSDMDAYPLFVWLHVPLFALLLWWTASTSPTVRRRSQLAVDAFLVIHGVLHTGLHSHEQYTFHSTLSLTCIYGAAAVGLLHGVLVWRAQSVETG